MRFRFCGDLDCPDWVLAEISILSRLTSVKMKLLCIQVVKDLLGEKIDHEKIHKLTTDAKFDLGDIKATVAAVRLILTSSAKYNVDGDSLSDELQQLGLPKEHAIALCKTYADNLPKLQMELRNHSLRLSKLDSVDWRVDYILSSSELKDVNEPSIQLHVGVRNPDTGETQTSAFTASVDKINLLLHELRLAEIMMKDL